jgi:DNA-binding response OmpR family regulator
MSKETILILERDKHVAWTLKTFLECERYEVIVTDSIERFLKDFSENRVSGLITEYRLDDITTLSAIQTLKKQSYETYVMMVTDTEVKEDTYREILNAGVDDFFLKPLSIEKILLHLKKGLNTRNLLVEKRRLETEIASIHGGGC